MTKSSTGIAGRVLVVGSLNMDLVVRVSKLPSPGDTVLGSDVQSFPGGKGANQAAAAARAGGRVSMLGKVGSDGYGQELRRALREAGVDITTLLEHRGPSGMAFITVDEAGENVIVVSSGANRRLTPDALREELFNGVAVVLMQLETPLATVSRVAEMATKLDIPTILNAAPARALDDTLLAGIDYLIINEGEAALLSGCSLAEATELTTFARTAATALRARGVGNVVVTLGGEGVLWLDEESSGHLPAHSVAVIDTTAAGDAFCGALATSLAEGLRLERAVRFANAAGALAATREGAQPSLPTRREITTLLTS